MPKPSAVNRTAPSWKSILASAMLSSLVAVPQAVNAGEGGTAHVVPGAAATIAETLKQNGYSTMALCKWHLAPYTAYTAAGSFDRWPLGMGFEKFFGFLGGETDQWAPLLVRDNSFIETPRRPGYHTHAMFTTGAA